jgi:CRISPR-associated protein Csm2
MPRPRDISQPQSLVSEQELDQIIAGDAHTLVEVAERLGRYFANNGSHNSLSTSQIRNVFGEVKRLQMKGFDEQTARELILLKPKLAYQAGRHGGKVKELAHVLSKAIDQVGSDAQRFEHFVDFFEAILAYHKAHGGK